MTNKQDKEKWNEREKERALRYVKVMALTTPLLLVPFFLFFIAYGYFQLSILLAVSGGLLAVPHFLIKARISHLARIWYAIASLIPILLFDQLLGHEANIRLFLINLAISSFYHFTWRERILQTTQFIISGITFMYVEMYKPQVFQPLVTPASSEILGMITVPVFLAILFFEQLNYFREVRRLEDELEQDIEDRNQLIEEKTRAEHNFGQAMRMASIGYFTVDMESGAIYRSEQLADIFNLYKGDHVYMKDLENFMEPSDVALFKEKIDALEPEGGSTSMEYSLTNEKGEVFYAKGNFRKEKKHDGKVFVHGMVQDITYHVLEQRQITSKLMGTEGRSRSEASERLNEEVSQVLSMTKLRLEHLLEDLNQEQGSSAWITDSLKEINNIVHLTLEKTKQITLDLVPPSLRDLGLEPALEERTKYYQEIANRDLVIHCKHSNIDLDLPYLPRLILFRLIDNILEAIMKNGDADRVEVGCNKADRSPKLEFWIAENSSHRTLTEEIEGEPEKKNPSHLILMNQVKALHGSLDVHFDPEKGNTIKITVSKDELQEIR